MSGHRYLRPAQSRHFICLIRCSRLPQNSADETEADTFRKSAVGGRGAGTRGSPAEGEKSICGLFDVSQFSYLPGLAPSLEGDSLV